MNAFIDRLFVVSLPRFKPGGTLYIVLKTCAASLVMYHCMVTAELTPANAVSTKLRNAARGNSACGEAPITDILHRGIAPEAVLDHWSQRILADFKERNPEIKDAKPDMLSLAATVNQHGYILNGIAAQQQQMLTALQKGYALPRSRDSIELSK